MPLQRIRFKTRLTRIEKAVFIFTVCLGVLLLVAVPIRWRQMEANPQISFPEPVPPSPNALDFYFEAGNMLTDIQVISYAVMTENQYVRFPLRLESGKILTHWYTVKEKEVLLKQNEPVLRLLRQGFNHPYQASQVHALDPGTPYYANFRGIASVLLLEAQVHTAHGEWASAANSYLDAMRLAADVRRDGDYIGWFIATACESIGHRSFPDLVEHLSARQARAVARRLESIRAMRPTLAALLETQKRHGQRALMEAFNKPDWREDLFTSLRQYYDSGSEDTTHLRLERLRIEFVSKRGVFQNYTNAMDELIAKSKLPYRAQSNPVPQSPTFSAVFPDNSHMFYQYARSKTFDALLLVSCALQAHKLEHRKYPEALSELVPAYLQALPDDAFGPRGGLRFKLNGQNYSLYSIGPDGKDNGGVPVSSPNNSGAFNYYIQPESQGDIVIERYSVGHQQRTWSIN